jgi:hypothetical protein
MIFIILRGSLRCIPSRSLREPAIENQLFTVIVIGMHGIKMKTNSKKLCIGLYSSAVNSVRNMPLKAFCRKSQPF